MRVLANLPIPDVEFERRILAVQNVFDQMELDCIILMAPEAQYWLSGYDTFLGATLPQALVLAAGQQDPTLVVWDADVAIAHETCRVTDIRTYRFGIDQPAEVFASVVREKVPGAKRIGMDLASPSVNHAFGLEISRVLAPSVLVDATEPVARLRAIKSSAELSLMRKAGEHARAGLSAAIKCALPGITETELAAEIEYAMRKNGSDYFSIPTEMSSGPRSVLGHGTPGNRVLEAGDLVHVEIGGVERRYNSVGIQTFVVPGAPPKSVASKLYGIALRSLRTGLDKLEPGVAASDVEAPALEILRHEDLGDNFMMRFGYGVGIGYPPSWLEPLKITRTSTDILLPGMTFVLHVCLLDAQENIGVLVGGTYALTESGYELLSGAGDVELV